MAAPHSVESEAERTAARPTVLSEIPPSQTLKARVQVSTATLTQGQKQAAPAPVGSAARPRHCAPCPWHGHTCNGTRQLSLSLHVVPAGFLFCFSEARCHPLLGCHRPHGVGSRPAERWSFTGRSPRSALLAGLSKPRPSSGQRAATMPVSWGSWEPRASSCTPSTQRDAWPRCARTCACHTHAHACTHMPHAGMHAHMLLLVLFPNTSGSFSEQIDLLSPCLTPTDKVS